MAYKFEIINNSFIITNTINNKIVFDYPKKDYYYNIDKLQEDPSIINIIRVSNDFEKQISFYCPLSEAIDNTNTPFTKITFQSFARTNLGFNLPQYNETDPIFGLSEARLFVSGDKVKLDTVTNKWDITGNAGTNTATNFIGTTDNVNFIIRTNNIPQLELRPDGSNFLYAPAIQGGNPAFTNVGFNTFNANNNYRWTVLTNGTINVTSRYGGSMTTDIQGGGINPYGGPSDAGGDYSIRTTPSLLTRFIVKNNGLIGINTTTPTKTLDINGEVRIRTLPTGLSTENILVVNGSGDVRNITSTTFINENTWGLTGNAGTNPATNFIGTTDNKDLVFKVNNIQHLNLRANGTHLFSGDAINIGKLNGAYQGGLINFSSDLANPNFDITYCVHSAAVWRQKFVSQTMEWLNNASISVFYANNAGNIGFGTTSPTKKVDINGELRVRTLPTGLSTENILVVNGSGDVRNITSTTFINENTWGLTGNAGTNPATNFIGTTDAQPFLFKANDLEVLRISPLFRCGIGTGQEPDSKFQVISGETTASGGYFTLGPYSGRNLRIGVANNHIWLQCYGSVPFAINPLGNSLGIGTTAPTKLLDINGEVRIRTLPTGLNTENILVVNGSGDVRSIASNTFQLALTNPITGTGTTNYLPKFTGASALGNSLIFDNGTNVGIGTTAPVSKLTIQAATDNTQGELATHGLTITSGTNSKSLMMGYDNAVNAGYINVAEFGQIRPLLLQSRGGNVGIGTSTPAHKLHIPNGDIYARGHMYLHAYQGDGNSGDAYIQARDGSGTSSIGMVLRTQNAGLVNDDVYIQPGGNVGIGTMTPTQRLHVIGNILASGTITPSDKRLKSNIKEIDNISERFGKLRPVSYEKKHALDSDKSNFEYGFIADEFMELFPELVQENGEDKIKSINYTSIIAILVKEIQILKNK